jgi:NTE family protein
MPHTKVTEPPINQIKRPPFKRIALLLQGGGALGSYQAGVYQALEEAKLRPDWIAGISIGAVNSALIAGNTPEKRVERLREFWESVSKPPRGPFGMQYMPSVEINNLEIRRFINQIRALGILFFGAPNFFTPQLLSPLLFGEQTPDKLSYYASSLKSTLEKLVDFDLLNAGKMHFSVGAVNVRTGNFIYFDNVTQQIRPEHIMASGSLPPGLPAVEIDGEYYWDGGLVSNTPLEWVLNQRPHQDTLAFQVDLWSATGNLPQNMADVENRQKDIRFSSRTRATTDNFKNAQILRHAFRNILKKLPESLRDDPDVKLLEAESDETVYNIVQLIYHTQSYEGIAKDFEFSQRTMEEHWKSGYESARHALSDPRVFQRPDNHEGFQIFDFSSVIHMSETS